MCSERSHLSESKGLKRQRRHWYRIYVGWCPVCMADKGYRERVYGPKPKDRAKRYVHLSDSHTYDWCNY